MKLSILVCSITSKANTLTLIQKISDQAEQYKDVEIICLLDNQRVEISKKRRQLVEMSTGKYVAFIDDNDDVSDNYIASLYDATSKDVDVINFVIDQHINEDEIVPCFLSMNYDNEELKEEIVNDKVVSLYGSPNHLMCIKRDIVKNAVNRPDYITYVKSKIRTEFNIYEALYFFKFSYDELELTMEPIDTDNIIQNKIVEYDNSTIDIVILSYAKTDAFKKLTEDCIKSLYASDRAGLFNVIVVESIKGVTYDKVKTIHPEGKFNYNKFANIGIAEGKSEYVCVCNNDLIFNDSWATQLLKYGYDSMSPKCPRNLLQRDMYGAIMGYETGKHISGWCICLKRKVWDKISGFDEDFEFWCADDSYREQLLNSGIKHYLISTSSVTHLGSQTLDTEDESRKQYLTTEMARKFNKKFGRNLFNLQ